MLALNDTELTEVYKDSATVTSTATCTCTCNAFATSAESEPPPSHTHTHSPATSSFSMLNPQEEIPMLVRFVSSKQARHLLKAIKLSSQPRARTKSDRGGGKGQAGPMGGGAMAAPQTVFHKDGAKLLRAIIDTIKKCTHLRSVELAHMHPRSDPTCHAAATMSCYHVVMLSCCHDLLSDVHP